MTILNKELNLIAGADYDYRVTVISLPIDVEIDKAWFTVKNSKDDADALAVFQKIITDSYVVGKGQIEDIGTDGTAVVLFELTDTETALLDEDKTYYFDVKVKTTAGKLHIPVSGIVYPTGQVTRATS
jgi:hypothetical protein